MADVKDILPDLARLDGELDDLEETLHPLLENLEGVSSQLPLLDKAKLFSLTAYAIESLLFSSLKLEGTDTQTQHVLTELKRVQQYFGKIKAVEEPATEVSRSLTVNQEAAARILKADLGDNKTISNKLAEKIAEERAKALLKSFETKKRPAEDSAAASSGSAAEAQGGKGKKNQKKNKKGKSKK
ncbi:small unique nuclear receptor co-repressor [Fusarium albosuccineum]|uniref:Exosome complex protein n=1 Tax=Fusarium albosuccineum TaxID=1237068 RepID=A0A8H4PFV7_9HYPO|nr:small unique nuclear receptor co-repressor [Fusarium albosuccineum]